MKHAPYIIHAFMSVVLILFIGACSVSMPSTPGLTGENQQIAQNAAGSNHVLWGTWNISINSTSGEVEIVPLRGAMFNANVTRFLQPPIAPVNLIGVSLKGDTNLSTGFIDVDVTLQHPFKALANYRGFDVRGIFMSDGSQTVASTGVSRTASDEARLLNADGYTRWWNASEFGPTGTIFGFTRGKAGFQYDPSATLNPYKYFADALTSDAAVETLDVSTRGTFATNPGLNTRNYKIQFPLIAGVPKYKFQYAVDASWSIPDPSYAPDYPIEAFNASAQMREPYNIKITDNGSTAFYSTSTGDSGGEFRLAIEVFDWQTPSAGASDQIDALWVEAPVFGGVIDVLPTAVEMPGSQPTSRVYSVVIPDLTLTHSGDEEIFVAAKSSVGTYKPNIDNIGPGFTYPDQPLVSYTLGTLNIIGSTNDPPVAIADQTQPLTGAKPLTVHLDPTGSYDPNAASGDYIAKYEWDIGADGTYELTNTDGAVIDHTFSDGGNYLIQLRVTDSFGLTDLLDTPLNIVVSETESWPMGFYDAGSTNYNPNSNAVPPLQLAYNATMQGYCNLSFIETNDIIYYPDSNGWLRAINESDGSPVWSYQVKSNPLGFWFGCAPAYWNGHVISGGTGMWSFDAVTGSVDWNVYPTQGFEHMGMVIAKDQIFVKSTSGTYKCMNPSDGSEVWSVPWSVFPLMPTAYGEVGGVGYVVAPDGYGEKAVQASDGSGGWNQNVGSDAYGNVMVIGDYAYFGGGTIYKCNLATGAVAASYDVGGYQPMGMCYDGTNLYFSCRGLVDTTQRMFLSLDANCGFRWQTPLVITNDHPVYSGGYVWLARGDDYPNCHMTAFDPATGAQFYEDPVTFNLNLEANIVNVHNKLFYFSGNQLYCWQH